MINRRVCALCGKEEKTGTPAMSPVSLRVRWAKEAGIKLAMAESAFLHPACDKKLIHLLKAFSGRTRPIT
jgi:hypothetical protein